MTDAGTVASGARLVEESRLVTMVRGLAIPALIVGAWSLAPLVVSFKTPLFVPLAKVLAAPFADPAGREIWFNILASLVRLSVGLGLGIPFGLAIGLAMGLSRTADRAIGLSFTCMRQITLFAWIPLLTAWFGNGELTKIVYVVMSVFFPVALNTQTGLREFPAHLREAADVLMLSPRKRIGTVLLRGALPSIFVGLQVALITGWIGTIGAEYAIGNGRGLGTFIEGAREQFRMDLVLVGVLAIAAIGFAVYALFRRAAAHALKWQE